MLFALVHLVLRRLFGFAGGSESNSQSKEVKGPNTPIRHATASYSWMRPPRRSWRLSFTADPWSEGTE